jgi:hypothetical protein
MTQLLPLQKSFEGAWIQEIKRLHDYIGGEMLPVSTYADASHPCAACSFDPGDGVFYNNGSIG